MDRAGRNGGGEWGGKWEGRGDLESLLFDRLNLIVSELDCPASERSSIFCCHEVLRGLSLERAENAFAFQLLSTLQTPGKNNGQGKEGRANVQPKLGSRDWP